MASLKEKVVAFLDSKQPKVTKETVSRYLFNRDLLVYERPQLPPEFEESMKANTISVNSQPLTEIKPLIQKHAKRTGIPPELLATIYAQESSAGTNSANRNPSIGAEAWRFGLTDGAKTDLRAMGHVSDFDSLEGVVAATADYLALRSKEYDYNPDTGEKTQVRDYMNNPQELYLSRYADPKERANIEASFNKRYDYYKAYFK